MKERDMKKSRFRVIKTNPTEDSKKTCQYEGTIEELCIELNKYLGGKKTRYRRLMEKWLYLYEQEHQNVHFKVWNMETKGCKIHHRNAL